MGKHKKVKGMSRFARLSRRARGFVVMLISLALVCFICLPLLYNGYLFGSPVQEEVYAAPPPPSSPKATLAPTPAPAPTPEPEPEPVSEPAQAPLESPPAPKALAYSPLKPEDESEEVSALQQRLMDLGYFESDRVTTYFGTATEDSVRRFQRAHDMEQTGVADSLTLSVLYSDDAEQYNLAPGNRGNDVRSMQRRLAELGYYEDKDNGYYGVATERAVQKYQKRNKLEQTGLMDMEALDLLYSPNARYLVDPTPTPTPKPKPTPTPTPTPKATPKPTKTPKNTPTPPVIGPDEQEAPIVVPSPEPEPEATPVPTQAPTAPPSQNVPEGHYGSGAAGFIAAAKAQINKPYIYGDEGPDSYDCSGLVYYCLKQAGIKTSRYSAASYSQIESWQAILSLDQCQAGDLLFFKSDGGTRVSHTGIYLGGGQFVHASTSAGKVLISSCTGYYQRNFVIARRMF